MSNELTDRDTPGPHGSRWERICVTGKEIEMMCGWFSSHRLGPCHEPSFVIAVSGSSGIGQNVVVRCVRCNECKDVTDYGAW